MLCLFLVLCSALFLTANHKHRALPVLPGWDFQWSLCASDKILHDQPQESLFSAVLYLMCWKSCQAMLSVFSAVTKPGDPAGGEKTAAEQLMGRFYACGSKSKRNLLVIFPLSKSSRGNEVPGFYREKMRLCRAEGAWLTAASFRQQVRWLRVWVCSVLSSAFLE